MSWAVADMDFHEICLNPQRSKNTATDNYKRADGRTRSAIEKHLMPLRVGFIASRKVEGVYDLLLLNA